MGDVATAHARLAPAGWLAFNGRELNTLVCYERVLSCYISSPFSWIYPDATLALLGTEPVLERSHARLRAIATVKPNRPPPKEIAHDDAISVALTEGGLVYASHLGCWRAGARQLRGHWRPSSLPARAYRSSVPHSFGYRTGCERLVIPDTRLAWFFITITDASALAPSWERSRAS